MIRGESHGPAEVVRHLPRSKFLEELVNGRIGPRYRRGKQSPACLARDEELVALRAYAPDALSGGKAQDSLRQPASHRKKHVGSLAGHTAGSLMPPGLIGEQVLRSARRVI